MRRQNTQKVKKIATCLAIIFGCIVWGIIISFVIKTESNRKIAQEKIKTQISQSADTDKPISETTVSLSNRENETITTHDLEKQKSSDADNTISVISNNTSEESAASENKKTSSDTSIDKDSKESGSGLGQIDKASRDDMLAVMAPKFVPTKTNEAGTYVTYEGKVYMLPNGHKAGTTWDNTDKNATDIGTEFVITKNAINDLVETIEDLSEDLRGGIATDILKGIAIYDDRTSNGITYTWNDEHNQCVISGTTDGDSFCNLVKSIECIPGELQNGKTYDFTFNAKEENISLTIIPYANGSELRKGAFSVRGTVRYTIPPTWNGIVIRLSVKHAEGGTSVNETVDMPTISTVATGGIESLITGLNPITNSAQLLNKNMFPILTFIDDDAISVEQVEGFTAACEAVGIRGTLACLTNCWEGTPAILDALKLAEERGHNAVIHAYSQRPGDCWSAEGYNPEECTKNLVKGMRMMQEAGFSNYKYWVTPFNRDSEEMRILARTTGCNCRFIGEGHANTIYDSYEIERYGIYRVGFSGRTEEEIEAIIDDCYDKKGWLVFVTHFYENPDETAVKLTKAVTYAKEKGFVVATASEAWSYRKAIYDIADMF